MNGSHSVTSALFNGLLNIWPWNNSPNVNTHTVIVTHLEHQYLRWHMVRLLPPTSAVEVIELVLSFRLCVCFGVCVNTLTASACVSVHGGRRTCGPMSCTLRDVGGALTLRHFHSILKVVLDSRCFHSF